MNFIQLQTNLEELTQKLEKETFLLDLLRIYGLPKSTITLLSKDPYKLSKRPDQIILKNKVLFQITTLEEDEHITIDKLLKDKNSYKFNPRFIIVTDFETLLAFDTKTKETLDTKIRDIGKNYAFFLPWCGMEKSQHTNDNPADIRAAYKMDKLYQAIVNDNPEYYQKYSHDLNLFLSRLLFCFFAEDTGIFLENIFTNLIDSHTSESGEELKDLFAELFTILNTKNSDRAGFAKPMLPFPYVNGGLFETKVKLPIFSSNSRKLIIENGKLDWSTINPDIFGSMIQAVVHPGQRENLGMHYTSVPNIMKVIEPLFLNDLYEELENSKDNIKKLNNLRERIAKIKIFDPACGSGNFLIISYKELCKLEIEIIKHIYGERAQTLGLDYSMSGITLNNFYGIEIDDFAHEIARLSLYLAQHQINQTFEKEFGKLKPILPLKESGKIVCANATRVDWNEVCSRKDEISGKEYEIYVVGNPPYYGSRKQNKDQKMDLESIFFKNYKNLDYISAWFIKASKYIREYVKIKVAFVSTNSICQGEQVALLWPRILVDNINIFFAYTSFKWKNNAKHNAGVSVVIIGITSQVDNLKYIYSNNSKIMVRNINPYLTDGPCIYIGSRSKSLSNLPEMSKGNMPNDAGGLLFTQEEYIEITKKHSETKKYFRKVLGSEEYIKKINRYCLWIEKDDLELLSEIPEFKKRFEKVIKHRLSSPDIGANKLAERYWQFRDLKITHKYSIIVPSVSSDLRPYVPIGFVDKNYIITNLAMAVYDCDIYLFGIISSNMHMLWLRAVGGRLGMGLRYSKNIVYNSFPFPNITEKQKESLTTHVYNILEEREKYPEKTMADLYDPDKMPSGLREAHKYLDQAIDQIYRSKPFESDEERLAHLFKLYEEMIMNKTNE